MTLIWLLIQALFWTFCIIALVSTVLVVTLAPFVWAGRYAYKQWRVRPPLA